MYQKVMTMQKKTRTTTWETIRPQNAVIVLTDHHLVTHQEELRNAQTTPDKCEYNTERSEIRQISDSVPVNIDQPKEKCAQPTVHFIGAQDQSDAGSLTT